MKNLTLVIPAKEEKESLPKVLDELIKYNLKKIIVLEESDYSKYEIYKNYNCDVLFQKKGVWAALIEGIKNVKTKYFVFLMHTVLSIQKNCQ